jgi:hypothetical protein
MFLPAELAHYSDIDLGGRHQEGGRFVLTRKNSEPYP